MGEEGFFFVAFFRGCRVVVFLLLLFFVGVDLAKTILHGTVKGERKQGRQRKRWEDNIREWTGLEFGKCQKQWRTEKN